MLLLHLSDIHFRRDEVGTSLDPNASLRNEILRDAEKMCSDLGTQPSAILISGDVAFAGHLDEYTFALSWLEQLCARCGTTLAAVFVIPGNHDVVRTIVSSSSIIRTIHGSIKETSNIALDGTIRSLLTDPDAGPLLYRPLANYNSFAAQFFCDLLPPQRTLAKRDLRLNDGSILRIWGLNSAFVSSASDKSGDLFVDSSYLQIHKEKGVEHLVMCHHPCSWLRKGADLQDHLNDVARIQLFGHEHTQRIELGRDWVRVAASATHPDRTEMGWEPGYNLIEVDVVGSGVDRILSVRTHVRVLQQRPSRFRSKLDRDSEVFKSEIRLDSWDPPAAVANSTVITSKADIVPGENQASLNLDGGEKMDTLRDISVRFFKLSLSQKSAIAGKLGLLEEEDVNRPDFERFRKAFERARDRGLMEDLDREVRAAIRNSERRTD